MAEAAAPTIASPQQQQPPPPQPEQYFLHANTHAPNSKYPVLLYRDVLPQPRSEDATKEFLQRGRWRYLGTWSHIAIRHFHPYTHECYGIFSGTSSFVLGRGKSDTSGGTIVFVNAGDVLVLPAGTAHASVESSPDYRYIGVYPVIEGDEMGLKRYGHEYGADPVDHEALALLRKTAGLPEDDPVYGAEGPLPRLWRARMKVDEILKGL